MTTTLDFAGYLQKRLDSSKNQKEWAKFLGVTQPTLNNVMNRRRSVNLRSAKRWAVRLGLKDEPAALFLRLAATTHIPIEARASFVELVYEVESMRRALRALSDER